MGMVAVAVSDDHYDHEMMKASRLYLTFLRHAIQKLEMFSPDINQEDGDIEEILPLKLFAFLFEFAEFLLFDPCVKNTHILNPIRLCEVVQNLSSSTPLDGLNEHSKEDDEDILEPTLQFFFQISNPLELTVRDVSSLASEDVLELFIHPSFNASRFRHFMYIYT